MPVALPAGTKVYLALAPVDMRKGYDGLAASVQQILKRDPFSGHLFLFRGKRGDRLKALWWDGGGLCLFAKRLEKGRFVWPRVEEGADHADPSAEADADGRSRLAGGDFLQGLTGSERGVVEASESVAFFAG